MNYVIEGTVHAMKDRQTFSDRFWKEEIIIKIDQEYDNEIPVEFVKDNADIIRNIQPGDKVRVHFTLSGRYWQKGDRYFLSLLGTDCELIEHPEQPQPYSINEVIDKEGDLPF